MEIVFSDDSAPGSVEAAPGVVFGGSLYIQSTGTIGVDLRNIKISGSLTVDGTMVVTLICARF